MKRRDEWSPEDFKVGDKVSYLGMKGVVAENLWRNYVTELWSVAVHFKGAEGAALVHCEDLQRRGKKK